MATLGYLEIAEMRPGFGILRSTELGKPDTELNAMKIDITKLTLAADRLLATLTNRRHVAMVSNYRRHAMLEVSGRYEEILIPGMTVEEPEYWSHTVGGSANFKGMKAIRSLYKFLVDEDICVQMLTNERLMVNDWGFSSFSTFQTFYPARYAMSQGVVVDDMDAVYIQTCDKAMFWHYDDRNLLQNEIVWAGAPSYRQMSTRGAVDAPGVREIACTADRSSTHTCYRGMM
jgi:hypothetical protein